MTQLLTYQMQLPAYALSLLASSAALLWPRSGAKSRRLLVIVAALCWLIGLIVTLHGLSIHDVYQRYSERPVGVRIGLVGSSLLIAVLSLWALLPIRTSAHWYRSERQLNNARWRYVATFLGLSVAALLVMAVVAELWEVRHHALAAAQPPSPDPG